jgi:N-formylglutamate amidohydrolase
MIELGYLLETSDLESSADQLNQLVLQTSSIQSLARRLVVDHQPDELLKYFGNAIVNQSSGQFAVTPSSSHPVPDGGMKYFSGGYTTQHYHSYKDSLDVIQIELPKELRLDEKNRAHTIQVLIKAIVQFLDEHYLKKSKL